MATDEAMVVFNEVCGQTIPDFSNAAAKANALGFALNERDPVKDLSIEVKRSAEGVPMCDVVFGTDEQIPDVIRQLQRGFDLGAGIRLEDAGFKDTTHTARVAISDERRFGRHSVSLLLWGKK
jgi:hypothetical protein